MSNLTNIHIPDIGGAKDAEVIEILVKSGDQVAADSSLLTLEGDKATMEIPAPSAGNVRDIHIKVGDKVSQGTLIMTLEAAATDLAGATQTPALAAAPSPVPAAAPQAVAAAQPATPAPIPQPASIQAEVHAGPAVRRIAREFGVDLNRVSASGEKNRILKQDVQQFVKNELARRPVAAGGLVVAAMPNIDFSQFGATEVKPLSRIKKLTGINLHRSWVTVPHVTQFGHADITDLEAFREQQKASAEKQGVKLTPLVFIMKAVVAALQAYPHFNASLDNSGEQLVLKKYFNLGVAVDTPNGLVVPVVRDVDKKSVIALAQELALISSKARDKGLAPADMQGGCFTISSLGGIGGTAFTPIVNAPEVAILGVSKASLQPVYQHDKFVPRLMLPLSLSYDHRVIDGADGARFMVYLAEKLADIRRLLL